MNARTLWLSLFILGLTGARPRLNAADGTARAGVLLPYDIVDPSMSLAKHFQTRGDYATAVLLYDAILERDPSDRETFRRMIGCHEAMVKKDLPEKQADAAHQKLETDDGLSELPSLIPNQPADAKKPEQDLNRHLL